MRAGRRSGSIGSRFAVGRAPRQLHLDAVPGGFLALCNVDRNSCSPCIVDMSVRDARTRSSVRIAEMWYKRVHVPAPCSCLTLSFSRTPSRNRSTRLNHFSQFRQPDRFGKHQSGTRYPVISGEEQVARERRGGSTHADCARADGEFV